MAPAVVLPRDNASLRVTGPARIVDADGELIREVSEDEDVFLCRCGQSQNKPSATAPTSRWAFTP
jgi:CDGSH-type Zn-finger protein